MFSNLLSPEFWHRPFLHFSVQTWATFIIILAFYIGGLMSAAHALLRVRSAQGTIAWVICLVLWPFISVPVYWLLRRRKYEGYVAALRGAARKHRKFATERLARMQTSEDAEMSEQMRQLERFSQFPFVGGNSIRLLTDANRAYPTMIAAMRRAKRLIMLQFFIVKDDEIGCMFRDVMVERARAGVRVGLLYDPISSRLGKEWIASLTDAGVAVHEFKAARRRDNLFRINFRNHRKILTIDGGKEAFTGGLNIADEYAGNGPLGYWRDTFIHLCGGAGRVLHLVLEGDWFWATDTSMDVRLTDLNNFDKAQMPKGGTIDEAPVIENCSVMIFPNGPADEIEYATMLFTDIIHSANNTLRLSTPYLIPDEPILCALKAAVQRGVKVQILIPDMRDHWLAWLASFSYADELMEAGADVRRYTKGFIHQKMLIADDKLTLIGTNNMDYRSLYLNFEISAVVADPRFTAQTNAQFDRDLTHSHHAMTPAAFRRHNILWKLAVNVARLFAPIL